MLSSMSHRRVVVSTECSAEGHGEQLFTITDHDITIRKTDKATSCVFMNASEYMDTINTVLKDETKFKELTKDPTEALKKKLNKLISISNAPANIIKFTKLTGDYRMGYCYGNVKTHKSGSKLRPIISQIPSTSYNIAKQLWAILTPFVPAIYSLNSATDILDILKANSANGIIASLDVEKLFTYIPIDRTINYIIDRVYHNDSTANIAIPESILHTMPMCCTKEVPFTCQHGEKYQQVGGVAMGSPLKVLFANFYMGCIEEEVFKKSKNLRSTAALFITSS
ncbi:uncharacterized protein LOC143029072 [Oratosquilla oratoria]|uniref:uncharacterized protein LOC143029072 n=1 Tax=Oratosquilla oratoria TaxID=337810 RepID=UPI003F763EBB